MTLNTNKLKVSIETSIDKGFANLAGQLDKLAESLNKIDKLTGSFTLLANQLDISNKFRKNREELDRQTRAQEKANKKLEDAAKIYDKLGSKRAALETRLKKITGNDLNSAKARGALIGTALSKTKDKDEALSLLKLMGGGKYNKAVRQLLHKNYVEPLKDTNEDIKTETVALSKSYDALNRMLATKARAQQRINSSNSFLGLNFSSTGGPAGARRQKSYNNLFDAIPEDKMIAGNNAFMGVKPVLDKAALAEFRENAAYMINRVFKEEQSKKVMANLNVSSGIKDSYNQNRFRNDLDTLTRNRAALVDATMPQGMTEQQIREKRLAAQSAFTNRNMITQYGYGLSEAVGSSRATTARARPFGMPRNIYEPIPSKKSQTDSLSFSQRLYKSYAKLGEVLFRIQYATLTIANLGGAIAFAQLSDSFMSIESSIGRVSSTTDEFNTAMKETRKIAMDTYMSYEAVAGIYSKIGFEANKYKLTQEQTLKLTRTIAVLSAAGGGKAGSQDQALYQFQQSISSGKFGGDELRSVFEGAPMLARALAAGIQGTTLGNADISKLRPVPGGKNVNTADLLKGLQSETVQREVEKLARTLRGTFGGAVTNLVTTLTTAAGRLNELTGASVAINKFAKFFDDLIFATPKDQAAEMADAASLDGQSRKARQAEIAEKYKNIEATRELIEQLALLAATLLAAKTASMAYNLAGAVGGKLGKGVASAAITAGYATRAGNIGTLFVMAGAAIVKFAANLAKLLGPVGLVVTGIQLTYMAFSKFLQIIGLGGQQMNVITGLFYMFMDAVKNLGKVFAINFAPIINFFKVLFGIIADRIRLLSNMLGITALLKTAAARGQKEADKNSTSKVQPAVLTGSGFGGAGVPPRADPDEDAKKKAKEAADKLKAATDSYNKLLLSIGKETEELINSATFGNFFGDLGNKFKDEIDSLKEQYKEIGGLPEALLKNLQAKNAERTKAAFNKEIRDLTNNFAISSRASRVEGLGSLLSNLDSGQTGVVQNYLKFLKDSEGGMSATDKQNSVVEMFLSASSTAGDMADKMKSLGLETDAYNRLIIELGFETRKFANEIKKLADDLSMTNVKSNIESLFDYNQQASGVFGVKAESDRRIFEANQAAKERLISQLGPGNNDLLGKSLGEVSDVFKTEMLSRFNKSASTPSTVGADGVDTVTVTAGMTAATIEKLLQENEKSVQVVRQQEELKKRLLESPWIGAQRAVTAYLDSVKDMASQTEGLLTNTFSKLEDMFVNFIETGKLNLRDFAKSITTDIIRMMVRQKIVAPIAKFIGDKFSLGGAPAQEGGQSMQSMMVNAGTVYVNASAISSGATGQGGGLVDTMLSMFNKNGSSGKGGNILSSIFSMFNKGGSGGGSNWLSTAFKVITAIFHGGGMAHSPTRFRAVDPSMFVNAPKFHSGKMPQLAANEIPAILTKDEMVLTRSQQKAIGSSMGGTMVNFSPSISINYTASEGSDSGSARQDADDMAKIMNQQLRSQFKEMLVKEMGQGGLLRRGR